MISDIFKKLFTPRTNLEVVLSKITDQEEVRSAAIMTDPGSLINNRDTSQDLFFMIGIFQYSPYAYFKHFRVKFSSNDKECIVVSSNDKEPLFIFNDPEEISQIRQAIVDKYNQMIEDKKKQAHEDFKG